MQKLRECRIAVNLLGYVRARYFSNSAKDLWLGVLCMQAGDTSGGGGMSRESFIQQTSESSQFVKRLRAWLQPAILSRLSPRKI